jgi:hypothetical protein
MTAVSRLASSTPTANSTAPMTTMASAAQRSQRSGGLDRGGWGGQRGGYIVLLGALLPNGR